MVPLKVEQDIGLHHAGVADGNCLHVLRVATLFVPGETHIHMDMYIVCTVVREIFVVKKFSYAQLCTELNVRNFSSQYIKYVCYYGKGSPVQKYFNTKI